MLDKKEQTLNYQLNNTHSYTKVDHLKKLHSEDLIIVVSQHWQNADCVSARI